MTGANVKVFYDDTVVEGELISISETADCCEYVDEGVLTPVMPKPCISLDIRPKTVYTSYDKENDVSLTVSKSRVSLGTRLSAEYTNCNEEKNMNLAKKYELLDIGKDKRLAVEKGAMREDGTLTDEGVRLLCQILLKDEETQKKFYDGLKIVAESEVK